MSKETIDLKDLDDLLCKYEVKDLEDLENRFKNVPKLEAKLVESEKKAIEKNDESWELYLSLKQFYSRLGVEAYADDEIQDVAVKELNRLLNENEELEEENKKLKKLLNNKILLAEDGSVDVDKLEQDGFYVIVYRQGAKPPMWLQELKGETKWH